VERRKLKIEIDYQRCQGHARCIALAPELFDIDDYGNGKVRFEGPLAPERLEKARYVQRNCPEYAIRINDLETQNDG
jgi:ferredoxin